VPQPWLWAGSLAALVKITSSSITRLLSDYAVIIEHVYFTNMPAGWTYLTWSKLVEEQYDL